MRVTSDFPSAVFYTAAEKIEESGRQWAPKGQVNSIGCKRENIPAGLGTSP
jgi:hypothetical protein